MNVSSIGVAAYGNAAIASPPASEANTKPAEPSPAQQIIDAAKSMGAGQLLDKKV
jgi:hypothetical protein